MAIVLTVNGQSFDYPQQGDQEWGPDATQWASAVTSGMLQKAGGLFQLLSEVDLGDTYGLKSLYFKSRSSSIAQSGVLRLSHTDSIAFRDNANSGDLALSVNASNQLLFNGVALGNFVSVSDSSTIDLTLSAGNLSAGIVADSILNSHINSAAAIARSKLASGTANRILVNNSSGVLSDNAAITAARALVSDANGLPTHSTVTTTELGYVSGVSSSIQTQINAKLSLAGGTMSGTLNMGSQAITNVLDPSAPQDVATKNYVDTVAQGLNAKPAVVVATTANITLSGEQTIDGVLTSGSRVLVKNQSTAAQNGIYVSAAGAWSRAADANTWAELVSAFIFVSQGTTQADTGWVCTVDAGGTIGVTAVTFVQFSSAGIILAGAGLTKTGNTLSVNVDNSTIEINSNNLRIKPLGVTNAEISASAAIARSKLATLTASRAMVTDGSGNDSVSATTSTEIGYVSGVTSAIQTQLNGKLPTTITTTGDIIYSSSGTTSSRLAIGSSGQVLTVAGGVPTWATSSAPVIQTITSNPVLTSADIYKVLLVDTTAARSITLPSPAANFKVTIKDKSGLSATNNITIVRAGSEQIEGVAASKILQSNWGCWSFISDGTNWFMI